MESFSSSPRHESGQTLVLSMFAMVVLLGFAALVLQGGNMFAQRRQMQGTADAAALAGVQQITTSASSADAVARDYVTSKNASAAGIVKTIVTTAGTASTCNGKTVPPYSVCVRTEHNQASISQALFGATTERATAIATASSIKSMTGWLPFGVMQNQFVSGTEVAFRPGSVAPAGSINTPAGDSCNVYGGNNIRDVIMSKAWGGADACGIEIGQKIETQTGVTSGVINQGFSTRLGSNTDSFTDVFEYDAGTGRYIIKKPNSPRLGIVPLAGGTGNWPLSGGQEMTVSGYAFVYIGDRSNSPTYPAVTGSGNGLRIHLTPVNALLPASWDTPFTTYTPGANAIVAYRLIA